MGSSCTKQSGNNVVVPNNNNNMIRDQSNSSRVHEAAQQYPVPGLPPPSAHRTQPVTSVVECTSVGSDGNDDSGKLPVPTTVKEGLVEEVRCCVFATSTD